MVQEGVSEELAFELSHDDVKEPVMSKSDRRGKGKYRGLEAGQAHGTEEARERVSVAGT